MKALLSIMASVAIWCTATGISVGNNYHWTSTYIDTTTSTEPIVYPAACITYAGMAWIADPDRRLVLNLAVYYDEDALFAGKQPIARLQLPFTPGGELDYMAVAAPNVGAVVGFLGNMQGYVAANLDAVPELSGSLTFVAATGITATAATATEGNDLVFTVALDGAPVQTITVDYATADGMATSSADYTATAGTLVFPPANAAELLANAATRTITVSTTEDEDAESAETMTLTLTNPSGGYQLRQAGATGTIQDDD